MSLAAIAGMRLVVLVVLVAACREEGAELTFASPGGPATAASYQIILAAPELVSTIEDQRVMPTALTKHSVSYYLQRTLAGISGGEPIPAVDGFTVLLEPTAAVAASFIPFVLLYGADGQLVAIGTFHDGSAAPAPISIKPDEIDRYTIDIERVAPVTDTDPVAANQAMQVDCVRVDQSTWTSGVVWRPSAGGELRLMFPDDPTSTDATQRTLDLDCDGHAVQPSDATADCDDSRARFYLGAPDVCDGEDTNCDDQRYVTTDCTLPACGAAAGVQLCDDAAPGGELLGTCDVDPSTCPMGCTTATGGHCDSCIVDGTTATAGAVCAPAISSYSLAEAGFTGAAPWTVGVVGASPAWTAQVGASATSFGAEVTNVSDTFYIRVDVSAAAVLGSHLIGAVYLDVIDANSMPQLLNLDLDLTSDPSSQCQPFDGTTTDKMACQQ